jgi:hypothetical protein
MIISNNIKHDTLSFHWTELSSNHYIRIVFLIIVQYYITIFSHDNETIYISYSHIYAFYYYRLEKNRCFIGYNI